MKYNHIPLELPHNTTQFLINNLETPIVMSHILLLYRGGCSGDYGPAVTVDSLVQFHRRRIQVLANSGADLLAIETIPSKQEVQVSRGTLKMELPPRNADLLS